MDKKLRSIIFVDDDEFIGAITKKLLEQMQLAEEVLVFTDSIQGLAYIKNRYSAPPENEDEDVSDLILLDIDMPKLSGFEILFILRGFNKAGTVHLNNARFAIATSYKTDRVVQTASRYNISTVLEKPLRKQDIRELVFRQA